MSDPFVGEITLFAGNFAPKNYAFCDGRLLLIQDNSALFAILSTTYGGDGRTTFGLPKLDSFRVAIHPGTGPGLSTYRLGQEGGSEEVTLTASELGGHNHTLIGTNKIADSTDPLGRILAGSILSAYETSNIGSSQVSMNSNSITSTGGGTAHNNLQPYVTVHSLIPMAMGLVML